MNESKSSQTNSAPADGNTGLGGKQVRKEDAKPRDGLSKAEAAWGAAFDSVARRSESGDPPAADTSIADADLTSLLQQDAEPVPAAEDSSSIRAEDPSVPEKEPQKAPSAASDDRAVQGKEKTTGNKKFWTVLGISAAVLVVAAAVGLTFLWNYLKAYEAAQPSTALNEYVGSLDRSYWTSAVRDQVGDTVSEFEDESALIAAAVDQFANAQYTHVLKASQSTDTEKYYRVIYSGKEIFSLKLVPGDSVGFGLHKWKVDDRESSLNAENLIIAPKDYTVTVPSGSSVTVNGRPVGPSFLSETGIPYRGLSALEPSSGCTVDSYAFSLYAAPEISVTWKDTVLQPDDGLYYDYPASAFQTGILIVVPEGSSVTVNDVLLNETYVTGGGKYADTQFEKDIETGYTIYALPPLYETPLVKADLAGSGYELPNVNGSYLLNYPASLLHTAYVEVPDGTAVYVNGVRLSGAYCTTHDKPVASLSEYAKYIGSLPSANVYTVTGLFKDPEITVERSGSILQLAQKTNEETLSTYWTASEVPDAATLEKYKDVSLAFVKTYMKYVSDGNSHLYENCDAVRALMIKGTSSYDRIANIRIGLYYVTPSKLTYKSLDVANFVSYSDNVFTCTVSYSVSQNTYGIVVNSEGTIDLLCIYYKGAWKVAFFELKQTETQET